jgi:hypothetical protein
VAALDARRTPDTAASIEKTAYETPSLSAAILVPVTRFVIFWNATSRA